jgi:uncharacterized protein YdaU (DUF1376 family)
MHYYQFNIGDYQSHTKHLSPTEDICYRRLLDFYYLHESPIQNDLIKITRLLCLNKEYLSDVESVLSEFFILTDDGWINHRANKEIEQYQSFSEAGKRGAAKRWSRAGDSEVIGGLSGGVSEANANHKPITTNHKPLTSKHKTNNKLDYEIGYGWINYEAFLEKAEVDFPYVDILKEFDKAGAWIKQKPSQRLKTDYNKFMLNWIKRVADVTPNPNEIFEGAI